MHSHPFGVVAIINPPAVVTVVLSIHEGSAGYVSREFSVAALQSPSPPGLLLCLEKALGG